jgi:hypothetical protein
VSNSSEGQDLPRCLGFATVVALSAAFACEALASVTLYQGSTGLSAWSAASGSFTTIDFTGYPQGTLITTQYEELGVTFTSSDPDFVLFGETVFLSDGVGLNGLSVVELTFSQPSHAFAYHHPGRQYLMLFWQGNEIYSSPILGGSGVGFFDGLTSTLPFDQVRILRLPEPLGGNVSIDNIYFSTVPGPSGAALLALAGLIGPGRRRSQGAVERSVSRCGR